jgi:signal recognition particle GTPase
MYVIFHATGTEAFRSSNKDGWVEVPLVPPPVSWSSHVTALGSTTAEPPVEVADIPVPQSQAAEQQPPQEEDQQETEPKQHVLDDEILAGKDSSSADEEERRQQQEIRLQLAREADLRRRLLEQEQRRAAEAARRLRQEAEKEKDQEPDAKKRKTEQAEKLAANDVAFEGAEEATGEYLLYSNSSRILSELEQAKKITLNLLLTELRSRPTSKHRQSLYLSEEVIREEREVTIMIVSAEGEGKGWRGANA